MWRGLLAIDQETSSARGVSETKVADKSVRATRSLYSPRRSVCGRYP
jgi:hypothetical protein